MRIVVVGGTGGFGTTICRMLIEDGHRVVAIGRDRHRGSAACQSIPGLEFRCMDRSDIGEEALEMLDADVLVDASGPFQGAGTRLVEAAIDAGCHYVDIADDRAHVRAVRALDDDARRSRVCAISGASSVPALSGAVAMLLSDGMEAVDRVDVSITASSRAAFGRSVLASMLSGAGRPIRHRAGEDGTGMMEYRRIDFQAGEHVLSRHVLSCDVPDHDELAHLMPGMPDVRFRAGSEHPLHNWTMWALALAVKIGILRDGRSILPLASMARRLLSHSGDGRSGMMVEVRGRRGGQSVFRRWTLVAVDGHGPTIPCLAVPSLIQHIADGRIAAGARSAAGSVGSDMLRRMPVGSIVESTIETVPEPLYRRVMGRRFDDLAPAVRAMHDDPWVTRATGRASVSRSRNPVARLICRIMGFPPASPDMPVSVTFERMGDEERWTRRFGGNLFRSRLSHVDGHLVESFGPLSFRFSLEEREGGIAMIHGGWSAFGFRMPAWLGPSGTAVESGDEGLFAFDVPIAMPLIGEVIRYRGWLQPDRTAE